MLVINLIYVQRIFGKQLKQVSIYFRYKPVFPNWFGVTVSTSITPVEILDKNKIYSLKIFQPKIYKLTGILFINEINK